MGAASFGGRPLMRGHRDGRTTHFARLPRRLRLPLWRCARGELPPNVALANLFMAARDEAEAADALKRSLDYAEQHDDREGAMRIGQAGELWERTPGAFAAVNDVLGAVDHDHYDGGGEQALAYWAAAFDRAAETSPAAGVALYSLGSSELLRAATEEIVTLLRAEQLLTPSCAVLDLGCGSGRVLAALAPTVGMAVGIDISWRMLEAARDHCAGQTNVHLVRTSGRDLAAFAEGSFDLVLAVDAFPYLVQAELAVQHVRECGRVLKPGGKLLILNYSYRGDLHWDRAELAELAGAAGLAPVRDGTRDFRLWDGCTFLFRKPRTDDGAHAPAQVEAAT
jgi:SAM-dependent methyltransferase